MKIIDTLTVNDVSGVRVTEDGYLAAIARVARTGIQIYQGSEVGRPDLEQVRVYRSEDEVFNVDSLKSYTHRPMTNDHPDSPVTSKNWKDLAIGQLDGEVLRDGKFIRMPMLLMDEGAIKRFKDGKNQLSLGYTCDLAFESGTTPDGETYDAVQRNIRANHLALVKAARGGPALKIGDDTGTKICPECKARIPKAAKECPECGYEITGSADASAADAQGNGGNTGDKRMKTLVVDGITCEMSDTSIEVVKKALANMDKAVKDATAETEEEKKKRVAAEEKASKDAATVTARDVEVATLKKQLDDSKVTPALLDQMVKDRNAVIGKAKGILADKLVVDGKSLIDIQKQVVNSVMGDAAKDWDDKAIGISFASITRDVKEGVNDVAGVFLKPGANGVQAADAAIAKYDTDLENAWKTPAAA